MGKTPKEKDGNERRRPYNYPRNAQAQTRNSSTESRNYSYPSGNVPRRIPVYNLPYQGIPGPVPNQPYHFGAGRGYRGRHRGNNKPLKNNLGRQRRPDLRNKRVLSPLRKKRTPNKMQSQPEGQEVLQEKHEGEANGTNSEKIVKNGPENCSSQEDLKDEVVAAKTLQMENGSPEVTDKNSDGYETSSVNDKMATEDEPEKMQTKPKSSKEKKTKKNATSPKGKSPKTKKEQKTDDEVEIENKEKEPEKNNTEAEAKNQESVSPERQSSAKPVHVTPPPAEEPEVNDSVVEIPQQDQDIAPSTSAEEKLPDTHSVKDSPRRSTRLTMLQYSPKPKSPAHPDSSSVIVLDSDDSISIMEISRTSPDKSFAQSLRGLSGRASLRPLPVYNRSFNRPAISYRSTISNKSDSESEDTKSVRSKSSLWGLFRTNQNASFQDSATDNEESTNRSVADDSGNDSEATTEPFFEAASNVSFGKRKIEDTGLTDEVEQEKKRPRAELGQRNNTNTSSRLLSIMSSPMHLFASKIRSDKGKSSTPVQLLEPSDMDEEAGEEDTPMQQDNVSEIQYDEDDNSKGLSEKASLADVSSKVDEQEVAPKRWCSVM